MKKINRLLISLSLLGLLVGCDNNSSISSVLSSSSSSSSSSTSTSNSSDSSSNTTSSSTTSTSSNTTSTQSSSTNTSISSQTSSTSQSQVTSSINFGTEAYDNSAYNQIESIVKSNSQNINVKSVEFENCYSAPGYTLKMSSSKTSGSITFNFQSNINILNLKVYAFSFNNKNDAGKGKLTVSNSSSYSKTNSVSSSTSYSDSAYLEYSNIGESSYITFEAVKRIHIAKIEITYKNGQSSSTSDSSSSSSSSSSIPSSSSTSHYSSNTELGYYQMDIDTLQNQSYKNYGYYSCLGEDNTPSLGNSKLLVIPVYFSNGTAPSQTQLDTINTAFFGDSDSTEFESLSSYYKKSSYGKLNLTGTVTAAYQYSKTDSSVQSSYDGGNQDITTTILESAVSWAKSKGYLDSSFDTNSDGYYDGIDLIYFTDLDVDASDLWWAFTTSTYSDPDESSPVAGRYFWAPYSMIQTGYYNPDIDAHTLIHESGHMLGLDDYYSYGTTKDGLGYDSSPCGMVDMMDCNVGDHNAFSKMLMGWAAPKVATLNKSFDITLNSFTDTGDFLLIPTSLFNGTIYDEYIILQYYTPTNLNQKDSSGYKEWSSSSKYGHGGTYASSGLQMYHVDNRVLSAKYDENTGYFSSLAYSSNPLTDEIENSDGTYTVNVLTAHSNTKSYSIDVNKSSSAKGDASTFTSKLTYNSNNKLISIIPANGSDVYLGSNFASSMGTMNNLFTKDKYNSYSNSNFSKCYTNNGKMDNGTEMPYSFTITDQTDTTITIHLELNQ